jgi:TfoX/Sxy family transcriptional regulator of competence genes
MADIPPTDHAKLVSLYDHLISLHPEIVRKGKNNPYTSLNGHMFTMVTKEGQVGFRVSKEERSTFMNEVNDQPVVTYNTVMKEYICIPISILEKPEDALPYLQQSLRYVKSLKPKPTKKKK